MPPTKSFLPTPLLDAVLDHDNGLTYEGLEPRHLEIADIGIAFEYQRGDLAAFEALARIPLPDLPLQIVSPEMSPPVLVQFEPSYSQTPSPCVPA